MINMMGNIILAIQMYCPQRKKSERERERMKNVLREMKYVKSIEFTSHFEHANWLLLKSINNNNNNDMGTWIFFSSFLRISSCSHARPFFIIIIFCRQCKVNRIESNSIHYKNNHFQVNFIFKVAVRVILIENIIINIDIFSQF